MISRKQESGERIRQARLALSLSQAEIAKTLKITSTTVRNWETGRTSPRPRSWPRLSKLLQRDTAWLQASDAPPETAELEPQTTTVTPNELIKRFEQLTKSPAWTDEVAKLLRGITVTLTITVEPVQVWAQKNDPNQDRLVGLAIKKPAYGGFWRSSRSIDYLATD
jgi:transcriptional regulator with XRE-family HTH domain